MDTNTFFLATFHTAMLLASTIAALSVLLMGMSKSIVSDPLGGPEGP